MPLNIVLQDITTVKVDAIVNTTNRDLIGYSGIDALIHKKAGPELDELCRQIAPLELGFAKITPGFGLGCKYIIHTSGPIWQGGEHGERAILKSCYLEALKLAKENGCESIAFPLISSGAYGYPKDQVLTQAVSCIAQYLSDHDMDVTLCIYSKDTYAFDALLFQDISRYIEKNMPAFEPTYAASVRYDSVDAAPMKKKTTRRVKRRSPLAMPGATLEENNSNPILSCEIAAPQSLDDYLRELDAGFAETLFALIDQKGMTDVQVYKKANVDRKTFSKIKCNPDYRPSKQTVIAFAIALKLNLEETQRLLRTVGLTLSHSSKFDLVIEYFILQGNYDIYKINEALFEFDQVLLGC